LIDNRNNEPIERMLKVSQICDMWDHMRYSHIQLFPLMWSICQSIL